MSCSTRHQPSMTKYGTNEARWLAVRDRDRSANSAFFYGVTTTQIFCRPTCPGRIAQRGNIIFFNTATLAKDHGYRACKRCRPDQQSWSRDVGSLDIVSQGQTLIQQAVMIDRSWTVEQISSQIGVSAAHLHRLFKKRLGITPKHFAASITLLRGGLEPSENLEPDEITLTQPPSPGSPCNGVRSDAQDLLFGQNNDMLESLFNQNADSVAVLPSEQALDRIVWTDWLVPQQLLITADHRIFYDFV